VFWSKVLVVVAVVLLRLGLGNLSTSLFCDDDGDRKWIFLPVGVLELSVKSSSFCANVKAFILALPPERKYISLASFAQNCFLILICSCYLFKSIFFHIVQLVYSDIHKTQIFLFFAALSKRCRRRPLMESQSKLNYWVFRRHSNRKIFMHIFISFWFFLIVGKIAELPYFAFRTMEWTEDHDVLLLREILVSDKKKCCQGRMVGIARRNVKWSEDTQFSSQI